MRLGPDWWSSLTDTLNTKVHRCTYIKSVEYVQVKKIQAENVEEESGTDNNFAMVNIHSTSATGGAVLFFIILALALGGYLIVK